MEEGDTFHLHNVILLGEMGCELILTIERLEFQSTDVILMAEDTPRPLLPQNERETGAVTLCPVLVLQQNYEDNFHLQLTARGSPPTKTLMFTSSI